MSRRSPSPFTNHYLTIIYAKPYASVRPLPSLDHFFHTALEPCLSSTPKSGAPSVPVFCPSPPYDFPLPVLSPARHWSVVALSAGHHQCGSGSMSLARARVRGRLGPVAASRGSYRGVASRKVVWAGLDPKFLIVLQAADIEENPRLLLDFSKLSRFYDVSGRSMAEKSSCLPSRPG